MNKLMTLFKRMVGVRMKGMNEEENVPCTVSHSEAEVAFSTCRTWLEQQAEATPMNLVLLQELHSLACTKSSSHLNKKKMTDYFKPI